jgi:hypothetical protein
MPQDVLEQLAELEVPSKPVDLQRDVHKRLNVRLLSLHLVDVALRALPYAFVCFSEALAGLVSFSATGRYPKQGDDDAD